VLQGKPGYLFPELKLSVAADNPVEIGYKTNEGKHYATFLTGSVDYLALGFNGEDSDSDSVQKLLKQRTLPSLLKELKDLLPNGTHEFSCLRSLQIEAKKDEENRQLA
jgi:hypothetical protein